MAAVKSLVADLNKGKKLTKQNYDTWSRKVQYILEDQELLKVLTQSMQPLESSDSTTMTQYRRDLEDYNS